MTVFQDCTLDHELDWPWNVDPFELNWSSNDAVTKPIFRLITEVDVRVVKPLTQYKSKPAYQVQREGKIKIRMVTIKYSGQGKISNLNSQGKDMKAL